MSWHERIRSALVRSGQDPDADVVEELAQHAQAVYDSARADGLAPSEAERQVLDLVARWQSEASTLRSRTRRPPAVEPPPAASPRFAGTVRDFRYAARLLRRQPRFTLLAAVTMALGIGATATLFSVTYGVLIKPLPWPGGDRLVVLKETRGGSPPRFNSFTNAAYLAWAQNPTTIESIAAWSQRTVTISGRGDPDRIRVTVASPSVFGVLNIRPLIGSLFEEKDAVDHPSVIVLSEGLWRQRFAGDERVLGQILKLDGEPYAIVGVISDALTFPNPTSRAWIPFRVHPAEGNYLSMFNAIARLRPGGTVAQAASEGTARGRFVADTGMTTMAIFGGNGPVAISATSLKDALTADIRQPLVVLLAAVVLLLLTATANVAGLHLARAETRRREMAIRAALGAGSARVIRQLLAESLLLGAAGSAAGVLLAWLLHQLLPAVLPVDFPRAEGITFDATVILFTVMLSLVASMVFGLLPAVRVRRLNLVAALSEDGTAPTGASLVTRGGRARIAIMVGQVAIACVLLVGASLLGRSFFLLLNADRGYDPSGILTARVSLPASMYSAERRYEIVHAILDRLATIPTITDAAFTSELPLTAGGSTSAFTLQRPGGPIKVQASPRVASARVFPALGMRIVAGRGFNESDTESAPPVVVVNRAFARRYLDDRAVGSKVPMGVGYQDSDVEATVVGVVDDVRYLAAGDATQPEIYYSFRQFSGRVPVPVVTFLLRTIHDPTTLAGELRAAIRQADDTVVPEGIATMEDRVLTGLARPRLYTLLLGGFAIFALVVAGVGLFAVLSQTVAERSREIAVRNALGARASDITRLIAGQGLAIAGAGLIIGAALAMVLARSLSTILYGITPHDRVTFIAVPLVLLCVSIVACLVPARRATKLDPVQVLRSN
jgi:putative ABC transport system permease protein